MQCSSQPTLLLLAPQLLGIGHAVAAHALESTIDEIVTRAGRSAETHGLVEAASSVVGDTLSLMTQAILCRSERPDSHTGHVLVMNMLKEGHLLSLMATSLRLVGSDTGEPAHVTAGQHVCNAHTVQLLPAMLETMELIAVCPAVPFASADAQLAQLFQVAKLLQLVVSGLPLVHSSVACTEQCRQQHAALQSIEG
jgi:hypothetical protein